MDLDRCIKTRCSTRSYLKKDISWDKLTEIIDSIKYAPSSGNLQNWKLIIIRDKEVKSEIAKICTDQSWVENAPALIVICNDESEVKRMFGKKAEVFAIQNCAAGIQNILLKANSLNIDSCWIRTYNVDRLRHILRIPDKIKVEAIISLGYAKRKPDLQQKLGLEKIVFFDEWGKKLKN
jgi:nitroreductase